jgi:hypothetical protein
LYEKKIWDEAIYLQSENKTREELNDFFTHPALSKDQTAWGSRQIGCENIISPEELKKHFKWNRRDMLLQKTYKKFWLFEIELTKRTPRFIKNILIHLRKT